MFESMTFERFSKINLQRSERWHTAGIDSWSVSDWATAAAGEMGEICNAVKKFNRIRDGMKNISEPHRQLSDQKQALREIGKEIADTVIYLDLLAHRIGVNLEAEIINKFNTVSETYGFQERL